MLLYQKVKFYLRRMIENVKPGQRLPSENELCRRFKVSRITVQRAWKDLQDEVPVFKKQGKGTFVLPSVRKQIKPRTIKVVFPPGYNPEDAFLFPITKSLIVEFKREHLTFILTPLTEQKKVWETFSRLTGLFWISPFESHYRIIEEIMLQGLPVIVINRVVKNPYINYVSSDHHLGGIMGTRYLLSHRHNRIGFIGLTKDNACSCQRYEGYCKVLKEAGKKSSPGLVVTARLNKKSQLVVSLFKNKLNQMLTRFAPTGLFITGVSFVPFVIEILRERKLIPGENIELVTFDEIPPEIPYSDRITKIIQPLEEIGEIAAKKMKQLMEGQNEKIRILLPPIMKESKSGWSGERDKTGR
ncbi:MAG: GntR family transcriptional regulator [Candidatus Omnitrophota bacterium]